MYYKKKKKNWPCCSSPSVPSGHHESKAKSNTDVLFKVAEQQPSVTLCSTGSLCGALFNQLFTPK